MAHYTDLLMELKIEANFIGPFQSYELHYSNFREKYQFRWKRPESEFDYLLNRRFEKHFNWWNTIHQAVKEAEEKIFDIHPFLHFRVNGVVQYPETLLKFI